MKSLNKTLVAAAVVLACGTASANDMYLDLGTNSYDVDIFPVRVSDPDTRTGTFTEFGFSQLLATSIYDPSLGLGTTVYDTNVASILSSYGLPASGTALDGSSTVNLDLPDCPAGQCDIDALSPLVPPLASDNEGFLTTWDLQVEYYLEGILTTGGPDFTNGYIEIYFNELGNDSYSGATRTAIDMTGANEGMVLRAELKNTQLTLGNLNLFFDLTYAKDNFLYIDTGGGYTDAADLILAGNSPRLVLDTNVNPPFPSDDQLLPVTSGMGDFVIRQTTLDGSITIPEPGTIAMLGMGLLGLGAAGIRRRRQSAA